jgi:hypothetical protein
MTLEKARFRKKEARFNLGLAVSGVASVQCDRDRSMVRCAPTLIGDMTRVSYSSSESEMQLYGTQSVVPWCANFESEINAKLFPSRTKFCARFDGNSMVRGDQASRYSAYSAGLMSGFLTVADVRRAEGLPFIPGTEQLNRSANIVPNTGKDNGPELPTP